MTDPEWAAFAAELGHAFRGGFGPTDPTDAQGAAQEATYRRHLGELPYPLATAALALLVEGGQVWLPVVGEIRAAVQRLTVRPAPSFDVAWRAFTSAYDRGGDTAEIVERVGRDAGEGAARWVAARSPQALAHEQTAGEHAGPVRHRLALEYATYVERASEDGRVGRALERAQRAQLPAGERPTLRRVDTTKVLGA